MHLLCFYYYYFFERKHQTASRRTTSSSSYESSDGAEDQDDTLEGVDYCLNLIGFSQPKDRRAIMESGLSSFSDFELLTEKSISGTADSFSKRDRKDNRIHFGAGCISKLQGLMFWIQDSLWCNKQPHHLQFASSITIDCPLQHHELFCETEERSQC